MVLAQAMSIAPVTHFYKLILYVNTCISSLGKKHDKKNGAKFAADDWSWRSHEEGPGSPYFNAKPFSGNEKG